MESKSNRKKDNTMKTAATTDNVTPIDSKKPLTKQKLITVNITLLIEQSEARDREKHSPTTSRP